MRWIYAMIAAAMIMLAACGTQTEVKQTQDVKYRCAQDSDCVSTCGMGCVSSEWAESYKDTCVNIRAFLCTCSDGQCLTDGKSRK